MKTIFITIITLSLLTIVIGGLALNNKELASNTGPVVRLPGQPIALASTETSVDSPDGKDTLTLKKTHDKESDIYAFSTKSGFTFSKNEAKGDSISIPHNSWSPDYKYIFLKETVSGTDKYLVLSVSNKQFPDGNKNLNITDAFTKKLPDFKLQEVTGWASPTLLVVNAKKQDDTQGPSFWYDINTQGFIQLSLRFN